LGKEGLKMMTYEIITSTKYGKHVFYTKANNGKDALMNLLKKSADYRMIMKRESDYMFINVSRDKRD
jgi:hypothetical protein